MPYKFPDRYPRDKDSVHISDLNHQFLDISEAIASDVSEHNIAEYVTGSNAYSFNSNAFYELIFNTKQAIIGFGAPAGSPAKHAKPQEFTSGYTGANGEFFLLPNTGTWETIQSMTHTSSNFRVLHLFAHTNYNWTGYSGGGTNSIVPAGRHNYSNSQSWIDDQVSFTSTADRYQPFVNPSFQVALRVNGILYNVTGHANENYRPHVPVKPIPEIQNASLSTAFVPVLSGAQNVTAGDALAGLWPGILNMRSEVTSSPAQTTMALSLVDIISVPPGTTTIELVARRLAGRDGLKINNDDVIAFMSRKLISVVYSDTRNRNRSITATNVAPVRKGDSVTSAALNTDRLTRIKTVVDSIGGDAVKKLNRHHMAEPFVTSGTLTNLVVDDLAIDYGNSPILVENRLPGETTNTFAAVGILTGQTAWTPLPTTSGGTTAALVTANGQDILNPSSSAALLITGHVHINHIKQSTTNVLPSITETNEEYPMAAVAFYYDQSGTRTLIPSSVVIVSRTTTPDPKESYSDLATVRTLGNIHVPLMTLLTTIPGNAAIDGIGICVSTINWGSATDVELHINNFSVQIEQYLNATSAS